MTIEEIRSVVERAKVVDSKCAFPNQKLLEELKACKEALPEHKHSIDAEEFRFLGEYITQTLFISNF